MKKFEEFKRKEFSLGSSILKCNELLSLWLSKQNLRPYQQYGAQYVCLQSTQIDELCAWVQELREEVQSKGRRVLVDLVQHSEEQV